MTAKAILLVGLLTVLVDQISKNAVIKWNLPQTLNRGFSFGMGAGIGSWIFLVLLCVVVFDSVARGLRLPDALIISGGFSNIIDRFFYGGVVDWIRISSLWFNFADISITLGVLWIFQSSLRMSRSS